VLDLQNPFFLHPKKHNTILKMKWAKFLLFFFMIFPTEFVAASDLELKIQEAVSLDAAGQSAKAKEILFEAWKSDPGISSGEFFFNLGVLSLKANQAGESFVYFSKALWMNPLLASAQQARKLAKSRLLPGIQSTKPHSWYDWIPEEIRFFSWQPWIALALLFLAILLWQKPSLHQFEAWHLFVLLFFLGTAGFGISLFNERSSPVAGIIANVKVLSGPESTYPQISTLEPGAIVNIEEVRKQWLKIRYQTSIKKEAVGWIESPTALEF
jgi:tetratricopeptide (TPR) repeat protein